MFYQYNLNISLHINVCVADSGASVCSRLSPSSSGYKSQSQRSDATISPSPSPSPVPAAITCSHTQISSQDLASPESSGGQTVIWAVTNLSSVPPGSIIINPQTNQPCTNSDGSIYRYDPDNPPKFFIENESGNIPAANKQQQQQQHHHHHQNAELPSEPSRVTSGNFKNEGRKQRSSHSKINTGIISGTQVTNTATSPSLPITPPPPPPPPPLPSIPQNPPIPQQQVQQQQQQQQQMQQQQMQQQQQQQSLVKSSTTIQTCSHTNQTAQQPYATYVPTSETYNQGVYPPPMGQPTVMMAPHPTQGQANSQGDVIFNQNQLYANYAVPMHQGPIPQSTVSATCLSLRFL